jgi:hypothetical protein
MRVASILFVIFLLAVGLFAQEDGDNSKFGLVASNAESDSIKDFPRHILAGTDLDQDGKAEIIITQYPDGGSILVYEVVANNTVELVWRSESFNSGYGYPVRSLAAAKIDDNDYTDLVVQVGSTSVNDSVAGLYFIEWDGTNDNSFVQVDWLYLASYDSGYYRTEDITVGDFDNDGVNEIAYANWGSTSWEGSRNVTIWSVTGEFSSGFYSWNMEGKFGRIEMLAPGSLTGTFHGNLDGDDYQEIYVSVYDNLSIAVIEADGEDSYKYVKLIPKLDVPDTYVIKGLVVADINKDGTEELFVEGTHTGDTWLITAPTGDVDDSLLVQPAPLDLYNFSTMAVGDQDHGPGEDGMDIYSGGGSNEVIDYEYQSGPLADTTSYTRTVLYKDSTMGESWYVAVPNPIDDLDGDGFKEVVSAWVGISDAADKMWFRVLEFGQATAIEDNWKVITPDDYVLKQNYPNPFNPTTTIEFFLPIQKEISLTVYNSMGQKIKTLVNNEVLGSGEHSREWDATNDAGTKVASGIYIYELKYGNFKQHKRMTLVK